jgi:hypothetical protein
MKETAMPAIKIAKREALEIERLITAVEEFRKLDPEMPAQTIVTFLRAGAAAHQQPAPARRRP